MLEFTYLEKGCDGVIESLTQQMASDRGSQVRYSPHPTRLLHTSHSYITPHTSHLEDDMLVPSHHPQGWSSPEVAFVP